MSFFSIVTPVYQPSPRDLETTIASVRSQTWSDWEWILVDDASGDPEVTEVLRNAARNDSRITVIERATNGHIVTASNDGLAAATGRWIVLLDHDDLLTHTALEKMHAAIEEHPHAGYLYSDEDKIDAEGNLSGTFLKPEWSPERLRHQMYLGHLSVLRRDLVTKVGGFHSGFDGSQDHDLALRVTEIAEEVVHVPEVLYHWRIVPGSTAGDTGAKDYATVAGVKAVQAHLDRVFPGLGWTADTHPQIAHTYVVKRSLPESKLVSVVIPTRGTSALVWGKSRVMVCDMVESLLAHTSHTQLEIVVVHDADTPNDVLVKLERIARHHLTLVEYAKPFNFSEKCNEGFLHCSGDIVVLMNDDMLVNSDHFIEDLCAPLAEESVGATGASLHFSDTTIQHAGLAFDHTNLFHPYAGEPADTVGYFGEAAIDHEVSGVTGACVAMRREVFEQIGGLDVALPGNFNDVDMCMKLRAQGYRILVLADVQAYHFESKSRDTHVFEWEHERILDRWWLRGQDPYMPYMGTEHTEEIKKSIRRSQRAS